MRVNKLFKRQKARKGSGRTVKIKHLLLPADVVEDLKTFQNCYKLCFSTEKDKNGYPIPIRVTYEQMIRRWMDNIGRIDPDVARMFLQIKEERKIEHERLAAGLGITAEQMKENEAAFDPADPVNEPWELRYIFEKDGEEFEAYLDDKAAFFAKMNGRSVGMAAMFHDGWILMNEVGVELDFNKAWRISNIIKAHLSEEDSPAPAGD